MKKSKRRGSIKGLSMLLLSRFAYKEYKRSSRRRKKKISSYRWWWPQWHWDGFY